MNRWPDFGVTEKVRYGTTLPGLQSGRPRHYLGLDLGQAQEYTALAVVERGEVATGQPREPPDVHYQLRHLERAALGTGYPAIVARVHELLTQPPLQGATLLAMDATGVGAPVVELLQRAGLSEKPYVVTLTAGDTVTHEGRHYRVPLRDLVSMLQVLLQTERLKIASALPEAPTLVRELLRFQTKVTLATSTDTLTAWREGPHDDLVLATGLACWAGEHLRPRILQVL